MFNGVLAGASAIVLVLMVAVVVFLFANGFNAFHQAGLGLITDQTWSPDTHHFGMMSLLVGSIAIAIIGVGIAAPVSIALALMINEYAPLLFRPWLTGTVDMLATVPSIVYGFWGLLLVSNLQAAPARWLVDPRELRAYLAHAEPGPVREVDLRLWVDLRRHDHPHHHLGQP